MNKSTVGAIGAAPLTLASIIVPEAEERTTDRTTLGGWVVIVFNNNYNTYDQVIDILMRATGCTAEEAAIETWEIDHLGCSVVHHADEEECSRAAAVIATIGIKVEVSEG